MSQIPLTLTGSWDSFAAAIINPNAPLVQRLEMRRAFHAGFCRAWELLTGHVADLGEDAAVAYMDGMEAQILAYMTELMGGAPFPIIHAADEGKPQ